VRRRPDLRRRTRAPARHRPGLLHAVVAVAGAALLGSMYLRDDNRLGLAGLIVLITAEVMAMVYAVVEA
jgi:hypothetical protein